MMDLNEGGKPPTIVLTGHSAKAIFLYAMENQVSFEWAESDYDRVHPLSPREFLPRVKNFILNGTSFATFSPHALCLVQRMVREKTVKCSEVSVIYVNKGGNGESLPMDIKGEWIYFWPEESDENSIAEGMFYLTFGKPGGPHD